MRITRLAPTLTATVAGTAALLAIGAGPATAGEVTGPPQDGFATGKPTGIWGHANSECAFSGQNAYHPDKDPARVQSYGALVSQGLKDFVPSPGEACNGHLSPMDWSTP